MRTRLSVTYSANLLRTPEKIPKSDEGGGIILCKGMRRVKSQDSIYVLLCIDFHGDGM